MGDGERVRMSSSEIKDDIQDGTADAARRAGIPELTDDQQQQLFDIIAEPSRIVGVRPGEEVIVTDDGCSMAFYSGQDGGGTGTPLSRMQAALTYERACGADTTSMGHSDYSYKPVKSIINFEANEYYNISQVSTAPFFYGAQPNMGLYFQPDDNTVPEHLRGIGIRIEDNILVTDTGAELLSAAIPRTADDVEAWMAAAGKKS